MLSVGHIVSLVGDSFFTSTC